MMLEFGRGQMVKEFDKVVFEDEVGVVHGPVKTQVRTFFSLDRNISCPFYHFNILAFLFSTHMKS